MKKNICIVLAIMSTLFTSAFGKEFTGEAAHRLVAGAEKVKTGTTSKIPEYIKFSAESAPALNQFESWMNSHYRLPAGTGYKYLKAETDPIGYTHYRYQQTINDIAVEGSMYILHVKNNSIESMNGVIYDNINTSVNAALAKAAALEKAIQFTNATLYRWQVASWEQHIKEVNKNATATWYPKGELVYAPNGGKYTDGKQYRLCYKFDIYAEKPLSRKYVFVDAQTGEVIHTINRIQHGNTQGTAVTAYSGTHTITTDSVNPTTYRLQESGRGDGIETYDLQQGTNYVNTDFTDTDNSWNNVNAQLDQYATDAHWGAEVTYDFYFLKFGRNSIDNAGQKLLSYVHYDVNYVNAFWDGTAMTYGDGDNTYTPLTSLDVTGHEISHGVTENSSGLIYQDESGAMNEAFSDCMGNAIRYYGKQPTSINWLIGDEIGGTPFRNMANPNQYQNPDCYGGQYWNAPNEVHNNSGVMNFWFYLLTEGGSGTNDLGNAYTVTGLGIDDAAAICYRMNAIYLTPSSDHADARYYAIQAAIDLFGPCTPEAISTANAWHAVGVGAAFIPGVSSNFTSVVTAYCQVPASVPFTNTSNNAGSFFWDFGDGTTSTLSNPVHVYTAFGNYTVKLVSDGGTCGIDSITKTSFISVDAANPCVVSLPTNGTGPTQTSCAGQLFDEGGPSGDYTDNSTSTITISPTGASTVELSFSLFDLEDTYDFLYIYDGATTNTPLLGAYTGQSLPGIISSTGSSITIRMVSDPFITGAGFALSWQCQIATNPPNPNFTASVTTSCNGVINFTDLSTNGPSGWLWDFGDGGSSTLQNPSHTYTASGVYNVSLTATNGIGSNSLTQTGYITINLPVAPTATGTSVCAGTAATLTATGAGTLAWYSTPTGGIPLFTGSAFTTPLLYNNFTYYVEDDIYPAVQNNGPADNNFGTGSIYTNNINRVLVFDCYTPARLVSVKVYAQGAGIRTITLVDGGTTLQSLDVNLVDGMNIVTLNFDLPVANNLELGCGGNINLYRNQSGAVFPYTLAGVVSITGTNAGTAGYYYFFYDWVLQEAPCASARTAVNVTVSPATVTGFGFNFLTNVVNFVDVSIGATGWLWDFGDGGSSTLQNPQHTYATIGTYTVTLTTTNGGTCSSTVSQQINITVTGVNEKTAADVFSMYPNPAKDEVVIQLATVLQKGNCTIKLTNAIGQVVLQQNCKDALSRYTINVSNLPTGVYQVEVKNADKQYYQQLIKQ